MDLAVPSFVWTIIYLVLGLWLGMRIFAVILQFVIRKKTGILVKIDRTGLGSFHKIHIGRHKGLQVEIDKVWFSSCYFNEEIRQPVVLCMGEVRIQVDGNTGGSSSPSSAPQRANQSKQFALPKFTTYLQYCGLRVQSLTVMLLKTMVPECLVHCEGQEVSLDISCINDCFQFIVNATSINCRALRSVSQTQEGGQTENSGPCLAEMSFSLYTDISIYRTNVKHLKGLRVLVNKPQMMLTEGLLSGVQYVSRRPSNTEVEAGRLNSEEPVSSNSNIIEHLPQELGIDFTDVDVKIVRETKQRCLSVIIKTFHVDMMSETLEDKSQKVWCTVLAKDCSTKSPQANFAELINFETKGLMDNDSVTVKSHVQGAFFHYHHEEVQYWLQVLSQLSKKEEGETELPSLQRSSAQSGESRHMVGFLLNKRMVFSLELLDISTAFSTATCIGLQLGVSQTQIQISVKPSLPGADSRGLSWLQSHDVSCEVELSTLYCTHCDSQIPIGDYSGNKHYWNHVLYMNILMIKLKKLGEEIRVDIIEDHLHIEWSSATVSIVLALVSALAKTKLPIHFRKPDPATVANVGTSLNIPVTTTPTLYEKIVSLKFELSHANVFVCNNYKVGLMLRLDQANLDYRSSQSRLTVEGCKLAYIPQTDQFYPIMRSTEILQPVASVREVRVTYKTTEREATVQVSKEVMIDWSTACHMCIIQAIEDVKELKAKLVPEPDPAKAAAPIPAVRTKRKSKTSIAVNIIVTTEVNFTLHLSAAHRVTVLAEGVLIHLTVAEVLMEMKKLLIFCDDKQIFTVEGILCGTMSEVDLKLHRQSVDQLILPTNRAVNVSMDLLSVIFPYKFDFARCFEEFVNFTKWLKLVHRIKKKPVTVDSKLPPDLQIIAKTVKVELSDDPFEVKLGDNYDLMKDEYNENEKRRSVLDQKVQTLKKGYGIIPAHKLEDLYMSLAKRSSDIYIQRSQQLYLITPIRNKLFTFKLEDIEIIAMADTSIHGKENVVKNMKDIDPDSPYPEEDLDFCTLWCRHVNVTVPSWTIQFRDYPQNALDVKDMNIWGRLIGAEAEGAKRAKRSCVVEVSEPWGNTTVERNLPALKFFHDFSCDVESVAMEYGACWEPVVAQYNVAVDLINKPSVDPSRPLPWWDKIRLLLHGRLTMVAQRMSWLYHASLDPYNTTELMDWTWSDLVLDWTNTKFALKGDLDIYARTASKYDDCKLLCLPNLQFCAKLEWLCLGHPDDHHSVMPCAPDKVPDYSLEEHDSFRAFRSQNLNLSISLETSRPSHDIEDKPPSCLFYASTLRFMDKIKNCLAGVTRPVRRGPYFNHTKMRKPQLSRHYKFTRLSVSFHQFDIFYWMSFSMQHGVKLHANSFTLELCNELSLVPVEDGLLHRPRAEWNISELNCEIHDSKIFLLSSELRQENMMNVSTMDRPFTSFFLSVSRVTYKRTESAHTEDEHEKERNPPAPTPTHNLQVYEMRGSWNEDNRTIVLGLYDSYTKAQALRRNLSAEALKGFKVEGGSNANNKSINKGLASNPALAAATPSPASKLQTSHAYSMLMKLVAESDSKSVAFTEEPSSANMDQLRGIAACQTDDVHRKNWLIELHNSQIVVRGCETQGFVIVGAAKAKILSCTHHPVWINRQLRSKDTWVGSLECMQYYATVDPDYELKDSNIPWLSKALVEDRTEAESGPSGISEMAGSGHSVGGIVNCGDGSKSPKSGVQLQRIISRCKCQFFYVNYGEVDHNLLPEVPPPPTEDSDMMKGEEGVDTFTLLHHDLNVCTNNLQYAMILDIVNNLLLQVELKKKEVTEKLQSMRFQLQLSRVEDQKTPILTLQESVREQMLKFRLYERELFHILRTIEDEYVTMDSFTAEMLQEKEQLESKLQACKERLTSLNEELSIRISCFKESQLQTKAQLKAAQSQQVHVVHRNEVCFKFAQWRLTEADGQVGIVDLSLRNFTYTKVNRSNDTWTHQLELGWVKMTNLIPNSYYKDVLAPRDPLGQEDNRKMTLRILCTERPPVGGIAVKEHFEVNVIPLQIQLTHQLFKAMMAFFFPEKDIDSEDQQDDEVEGATGSKSSLSKADKKSTQKKEVKRHPSIGGATDDIDKMKERAANNNTFFYIKIPEVSLRVSYKGLKEKNIEDVHNFSFLFPTLEYHNCIWTWYDLLMAIKNVSKRVVISQGIKQKVLHMRPRLGEDTPLTDVQQEEDKAKMLLGATLLAGQEKPVKKTLFGKSPK